MKKIHFIGIGGSGMSAIAAYLVARGFKLSGSDVVKTVITDELASSGVKIFIGHNQANLPADTDIVVYSSSISEDNPELALARQRRVKIQHRAEFLAGLLVNHRAITITGSHGKTTTSAMASWVFYDAGQDPVAMVGSIMGNVNKSALTGQGKDFIIEADESDGSFLYYKSNIAILTNIDLEHLDYYSSLDEIIKTYGKFINNIKPNGCLIANSNCPNAKKLIKKYRHEVITYGFDQQADFTAGDIKLSSGASTFEVLKKGECLGMVKLAVAGQHNVENALGVIALADKCGIGFDAIKQALASYKHCQRRFDIEGTSHDIMVVDDYAHHPAEIKATLEAARLWKRRVITVFQPHRYTRTQSLKNEFGESFNLADMAIFTDIYAASEKALPDVSGRDIYQAAQAAGHKNCHFLEKDKIVDFLKDTALPGDMVLVLGAGDIEKLAPELLEKIQADDKE